MQAGRGPEPEPWEARRRGGGGCVVRGIAAMIVKQRRERTHTPLFSLGLALQVRLTRTYNAVITLPPSATTIKLR